MEKLDIKTDTNRIRQNIVGLAWGFAEATLFFIIPDVYISYFAVKDLKRALVVSLYVLVGSISGGVIVYIWAKIDYESTIEIIDKVPAVTEQMLETVRSEISERGVFALLLGPLNGIPYKAYVAIASEANVNFLALILVSIPVRMMRFVLVTIGVNLTSKLIGNRITNTQKIVVLSLFWILLYLFYFKNNWI